MKVRRFILIAKVAFVVVPLVVSAVAQSAGQLPGCRAANSPAVSEVSPANPAYAHAADLALQLVRHRFIVICVAASKMTNMFEGQEGAALYRTTEGTFEALFLPNSQNFDEFQVLEQRQGDRYLYSFGGVPKPRQPSMTWDSDRPEYFVRHANQLIVVRDKQLATRIESAVAVP
ncbi:MAG TPA: hypothetical protein VII23_07705 [Terriglobales bacterium]